MIIVLLNSVPVAADKGAEKGYDYTIGKNDMAKLNMSASSIKMMSYKKVRRQ